MNAAAIDRNSDEPLHAQLAQWLRRDIRDRSVAPGTVLPSEAQLCERFGVARSVVRQALASLVNEGAILRHAGRAPTVAPLREHHRLVQRSTGMFDQFARTGVTLRTQVLALGPQRAPGSVAAFFGTDALLLLARVRYVDDAPLALVHTWLPASLASLLDADALIDASLHGLLERRANLWPGNGRNYIKAVAATPTQARQLDVAPGGPLLLLEGLGRDQHDRPMEYFFTWHRSEHLVFDVDVTHDDEKISRRLATPRAESPLAGGSAPASTRTSASDASLAVTPLPARDAALARAETLLAQLADELARLKASRA